MWVGAGRCIPRGPPGSPELFEQEEVGGTAEDKASGPVVVDGFLDGDEQVRHTLCLIDDHSGCLVDEGTGLMISAFQGVSIIQCDMEIIGKHWFIG